MTFKVRNAVGLAVGALALVAVPAFGITAVADAATGESGAPGGRGGRPQLTDEQKACLAEQGVTPPERPADGTRTPPTDEQRAAMKAAAEACGLPARLGPGPGQRPQLTEEQKACLAEQGVTPPERPADGTRTPPTDEQRAAMKAAAEACGLPTPAHRTI